MKTFKQIYKEVEKALGKQPEPELISYNRNDWMNKALDEWFRVCDACGKKFKNYRGVIIHRSRVHRQNYLLERFTRLALMTPGDGRIHVYWNKES